MYAGEQILIFPVHIGWNSLHLTTLLGEFGYIAIRENMQKVLKGEYKPPPNTDEYAKTLLLPSHA